MNDFDDIQPEAPFPFWLRAVTIVFGIPILNTIIPGSVIWMLTLVGCPDPALKTDPPARAERPKRSTVDDEPARYRRFHQRNP